MRILSTHMDIGPSDRYQRTLKQILIRLDKLSDENKPMSDFEIQMRHRIQRKLNGTTDTPWKEESLLSYL